MEENREDTVKTNIGNLPMEKGGKDSWRKNENEKNCGTVARLWRRKGMVSEAKEN